MNAFVGRQAQLAQLDADYRRARSGTGSLVWVTGRRRIGKSRLIEEFLATVDAPHVFFQAPRGSSWVPLDEFVEALAQSSLPAATMVPDIAPSNWRGALQLAATGATPEAPAIIVIDEFPYLHEADDGVDADVQHVWDRTLERLPVMLVCIGSDLSMMERLLDHDRPLHGRPTRQLVVPGLNPVEVGAMAELAGADAIDATLIVGGFPALARTWRSGQTPSSFLKAQLADSSLPLVTNGERILNAEFPAHAQARQALVAMGSGQRSYTNILAASGLNATGLNRALEVLIDKRVVAKLTPTSRPARKDTRYVVIDAYLRFWLRFVGPYIDELDRGRPDLVLDRIERGWSAFRGTSVEPVVREAVSLLLPRTAFGGAREVGSFWTRSNHPEIDLVGADALDHPKRIGFVGSIKWKQDAPFDRHDAAELAVHRASLPGTTADTLLLAVSRSTFIDTSVDIQLDADDLLNAWR